MPTGRDPVKKINDAATSDLGDDIADGLEGARHVLVPGLLLLLVLGAPPLPLRLLPLLSLPAGEAGNPGSKVGTSAIVTSLLSQILFNYSLTSLFNGSVTSIRTFNELTAKKLHFLQDKLLFNIFMYPTFTTGTFAFACIRSLLFL